MPKFPKAPTNRISKIPRTESLPLPTEWVDQSNLESENHVQNFGRRVSAFAAIIGPVGNSRTCSSGVTVSKERPRATCPPRGYVRLARDTYAYVRNARELCKTHAMRELRVRTSPISRCLSPSLVRYRHFSRPFDPRIDRDLQMISKFLSQLFLTAYF